MIFKKNNPGCNTSDNCGCEVPPCLIYTTDFSGNTIGADLGSPWTVEGTIVYGGGSLFDPLATIKASVTADSRAIYPTGAALARVDVHVFDAGSAHDAQAIIGYTDDDNYLYCMVQNDGSDFYGSLWKVVSGTHTQLEGPTYLSPNDGNVATYAIRASYNGSAFQAAIAIYDGDTFMSTSVTTTGTKMGFGSKAAACNIGEIFISRCVCDGADSNDASLGYTITLASIADGTCNESADFNDTFRFVADWLGNSGAVEYCRWLYPFYSDASFPCSSQIFYMEFLLAYTVATDTTVLTVKLTDGGTDVLTFSNSYSGQVDMRNLSSEDIPYDTDNGVLDGSSATCTVTAIA